MRQSGPVGVSTAEEVDLQHPAQLLRIELLHLRVHGHHHGGDERVDSAEALDRAGAEGLEVARLGRVGGNRDRLGAELLDLAHGRFECAGVPRGDDHAGAFDALQPARSPVRSRSRRPVRRRPDRRAASSSGRSSFGCLHSGGLPWAEPGQTVVESGHALRDRRHRNGHPPDRAARLLRAQAAAGDGPLAREGDARVQGLDLGQSRRRRGRTSATRPSSRRPTSRRTPSVTARSSRPSVTGSRASATRSPSLLRR